ncbi:MAG TPA: MarR family winged helix-turn-helix transcriptional regulator [Solirubrobacteraceae bacterium]
MGNDTSDSAPAGDDQHPALDRLSDHDYQRLAELRFGLRTFLHWSAERAKSAGLTPAQHQLLLAVRGSVQDRGPRLGDIADILLIRHHSAVELVDRAQEAGLIERERDPDLHSVVRVGLTARGAAMLASLSEQHLRELAQLAPTMRGLWAAIDEAEPAIGTPRAR